MIAVLFSLVSFHFLSLALMFANGETDYQDENIKAFFYFLTGLSCGLFAMLPASITNVNPVVVCQSLAVLLLFHTGFSLTDFYLKPNYIGGMLLLQIAGSFLGIIHGYFNVLKQRKKNETKTGGN